MVVPLNIEKNICFNPETDKPIIVGEIKGSKNVKGRTIEWSRWHH